MRGPFSTAEPDSLSPYVGRRPAGGEGVMNLNRNLASLASLQIQPPAGQPPTVPRLPAGRLTAPVRRGLAAFGMNVTNRRDLAAALRWLAS